SPAWRGTHASRRGCGAGTARARHAARLPSVRPRHPPAAGGPRRGRHGLRDRARPPRRTRVRGGGSPRTRPRRAHARHDPRRAARARRGVRPPPGRTRPAHVRHGGGPPAPCERARGARPRPPRPPPGPRAPPADALADLEWRRAGDTDRARVSAHAVGEEGRPLELAATVERTAARTTGRLERATLALPGGPPWQLAAPAAFAIEDGLRTD